MANPHPKSLTQAGILKVLCEHAHSLDSSLRLNALWALKHLVHATGSELKKSCLEELESGWLVQLICDDTEDEALFSAQSRLDKQGDTVGDHDMDEDIEMDQIEEHRKSWIFSTSATQQETDGKRPARTAQAEAKLAALHDSELNPVRKARNDDVAIQEQGLDFIRNLIGEPWATGAGGNSASSNETTEMIDFLFNELGQDRLFEILASKLRPRYLHAFSRRSAATAREARVLYPQAKIIAAVIYILVHMAASVPKHRQLVIAQTELLKLVGNHSSSKDKEVRLALCHLITNLTLQDDTSDATASAQRAVELKKLGFLNKLEMLEQEDSELLVKEQAKTAVWQMKHVLSTR
jgi:armadillo repeat-containing protein 8